MVEFRTGEEAMSDFILKADRELKARREGEPRETVPFSQGEPEPKAVTLLRETIRVITERRANYGPPAEHFARTIGMLNALFAHKLREPFVVADWPQIMLCDKMARHQERPIRDNVVDSAGYAACWGECLTGDSQK